MLPVGVLPAMKKALASVAPNSCIGLGSCDVLEALAARASTQVMLPGSFSPALNDREHRKLVLETSKMCTQNT